MELNPYLSTKHKINSRWTKDLTIKVKLLESNTEKLYNLRAAMNFEKKNFYFGAPGWLTE